MRQNLTELLLLVVGILIISIEEDNQLTCRRSEKKTSTLPTLDYMQS